MARGGPSSTKTPRSWQHPRNLSSRTTTRIRWKSHCSTSTTLIHHPLCCRAHIVRSRRETSQIVEEKSSFRSLRVVMPIWGNKIKTIWLMCSKRQIRVRRNLIRIPTPSNCKMPPSKEGAPRAPRSHSPASSLKERAQALLVWRRLPTIILLIARVLIWRLRTTSKTPITTMELVLRIRRRVITGGMGRTPQISTVTSIKLLLRSRLFWTTAASAPPLASILSP